MSGLSSAAFADFYSSDIHKTQIDKSVKTCPSEAMPIAKEILELEFAGMRWRKSDPKCFESLKMKYVKALKVPDAHALKMVKIKPGSLKIISVKENKEFYSQDITFSVTDENGKEIKDQMSFMTNADWNEKQPVRGCALISSYPKTALVRADCL